MVHVIISFVFIVLIAAIVIGVLEGCEKNPDKGKKIAKTIIICFVFLIILSILTFALSYKYSQEKTASIIHISEIYDIDNEHYLIKDDKGNSFTINFLDVKEVLKGDGNYIIHTTYPNSSGLSNFLINGPEDKCTIILKDFNIPKIDKLSN